MVDAVSLLDLSVGQTQDFSKSLTKLNTDVLFTHVALGEGPVYRINPNGPQDIKIDNKFIDDLITEFNQPDPYVFQYKTSTGSINQQTLFPFSTETVNNIRFSSPVLLKSGQVAGLLTEIPESNVVFYPTSANVGGNPIDTVVFKFSVDELFRNDNEVTDTTGNREQRLDLRLIVHPREETSNIDNYVALVQKSFTALITFPTTLEIPVSIPEASLSTSGYRVSALKASDDSNDAKISSEVSFLGIDEVTHEPFTYPRTASIGYALKATNIRNSQPEYSSLIKGLIVKVPSNYDQPILDNGEVDWRELEVNDPTTTGYKLQSDPDTILYDANPLIYKGIWDGEFKYDWTQNPVWVIYDILTNTRYGIGIPSSYIDKFNFYKIAQFCDAVDPTTGKFVGVNGYGDGTFRHKPRGQFTSFLDNQLGISSGTSILERRITCNLNLSNSLNGLEAINKIAASFKGYLDISSNKIQLVVDLPNQEPELLLNEVNLSSIRYSGVRKEDYITGVEVTFLDGANNYRRDIVKITDPELDYLEERLISLEFISCSKRSEATRIARNILNANKNIKRKAELEVFDSCEDLRPGSIISVASQTVGSFYGYNGVVQENSSLSNNRIKLQHISYPSISNNTITANTNPLVLRHFSKETDKIELYILSNTSFYTASSGNTSTGIDYIEVEPVQKWDKINQEFSSFTSFDSYNIPKSGDLWALGFINPSDFYSSTTDRLFRVDTITMSPEGITSISASEYLSNNYSVSEQPYSFEGESISNITNPYAPPDPTIATITTEALMNFLGSVSSSLTFNISGSQDSNYNMYSIYVPTSSYVQITGIV